MSEHNLEPRHLAEYERVVDRELDQREWELDDTRMIPKPPPRHRATQLAWQRIREHFAQSACWVCGQAWTDLHHIYPRSKSGDDVIGNLAPLCRECHARVEARDPLARGRIRERLDSANFAYLGYRIGVTWQGWIERHYPTLEEAA